MADQKDQTLFEEVESLERISPNGVTFDVLKRFAAAVEVRISIKAPWSEYSPGEDGK